MSEASQALKKALNRAKANLKDGRPSRARDKLLPWIEGENAHPAAIVLAAKTLAEEQNFDDAVTMLEAARKSQSDSFAVAFKLGQMFGMQGLAGKAVTTLLEAQKLDASNTRALDLALKIAFQTHNHKLALALVEAILDLDSTRADAEVTRIEVLSAMGDEDAARAQIDSLLDLDTLAPGLLYRVVRVLCDIGNVDPALNLAERIEDGHYRDIAYNWVLVALMRLGRLQDVRQILDRRDCNHPDLNTARFWLRLSQEQRSIDDVAYWQDVFGRKAAEDLPSATLSQTVLQADRPGLANYQLAQSIRIAHKLTRSAYSLDRFRTLALKGSSRTNAVRRWWHSGRPRANEIDALIVDSEPGPLSSILASNTGAIVVNSHAGPTLAAVWWLQNLFEQFHAVGDPFGSPYRVGELPLEINASSRRFISTVRLLMDRLNHGAVLGFASPVPGSVGANDSVAGAIFGQTYHVSSLPPRIAHATGRPIFWVQPLWVGSDKIRIQVARMVSPRPGESRAEFASRWAQDFLQRTESALCSRPENVWPQAPVWRTLAASEALNFT